MFEKYIKTNTYNFVLESPLSTFNSPVFGVFTRETSIVCTFADECLASHIWRENIQYIRANKTTYSISRMSKRIIWQ
jgi:hypothetical protein